jgi:hypothetical protein
VITIVCVYNDKCTLDEYLLKGLQTQTNSFELILVDNTKEAFKSAAQALNQGAQKTKGEHILFAHQDIIFMSNRWLEDAEKYVCNLPQLGIAGIAGKGNVPHLITNIKQGEPPRLAGNYQIDMPMKTQTLDECLVIIPRSIFNLLKFDENTCDDWHLYVVDYCLSVNKLGYDVYVLPLYAYHRSMGCISPSYYSTLKKLVKKHKKDYDWIYTTMGIWKTSPLWVDCCRLCRNLEQYKLIGPIIRKIIPNWARSR